MIKKKTVSVVMASLLAGSASAFAAENGEAASKDDRQLALSALSLMSGYLRSLDRFRVQANVSKDEVLVNGQKLQFDSTVEMTANPPHKLFAEVSSTSKKRQYFYDGKQFTLYTPILNYYATLSSTSRMMGI